MSSDEITVARRSNRRGGISIWLVPRSGHQPAVVDFNSGEARRMKTLQLAMSRRAHPSWKRR